MGKTFARTIMIEPTKPNFVNVDKNQFDKFEELILNLVICDNETRRIEILKEMKSRITVMRNLIEMEGN